MPKRLIDINLINAIIDGDKNLFELITNEYFDIILYHIKCIVKNDEVAQDLTNDVFVKVYKNLNLYKPTHKFSTWVYKIATNTAIDYLRKDKLYHDFQRQTEAHEQVADESNPELEMQRKQNYATLNDAIDKLKPSYRTIIKMRYYDELSYEDIAQKLNVPIGTIKASLHRAKSILATLIINQKR